MGADFEGCAPPIPVVAQRYILPKPVQIEYTPGFMRISPFLKIVVKS